MIGFFSFWKTLIYNPSHFFKNDFDNSNSPYLITVLLTYGVADQFNRMTKQLMKIANGLSFDLLGFSESWGKYLIILIVFGALAGAIYYYLGGWWFNQRIKFCGGIKDIRSSRFIYLYSLFPYAMLKVLVFLPEMILFKTPMEAYLADNSLSFAIELLVISFLLYSIRISYVGAITVFELNNKKAKFWFLALPVIFYITVFALMGWFFNYNEIK